MESAAHLESPRYANYEIVGTLGRGAMGVVHLAKDKRIGRRVALKAVHYDRAAADSSEDAREFFDRLRREAELCGMLQHPNIVTLYEAGVENGAVTFLAFEYVEGESLRQTIRAAGRLPLDEAFSYAEAILKGLAYAHSRGVIHRDIKPGNILIDGDGAVKIADFGIARPSESTLTLAGSLIGTPSYMSPEQVSGDPVSPASDLFSVGAVLYEMLTGAKPFAAVEINAVLFNVVHRDAAPPSSLRPELDARVDAFVAKLLAKNPADRFASAADALEALVAIRGTADAPLAKDFPRTVRRAWPRMRVHPAIAAAVIAALLLPLAVGAYRMGREANRGAGGFAPVMEMEAIESKRQQMAGAAKLLEEGKLDEGIAAYEAFVAKYPTAVAASESLAAAKLQAEELARATEATDTDSAADGTPAAATVEVSAREAEPSKPNAARRGWNTLRKKVKGVFQ